jgi:hypothetical protein
MNSPELDKKLLHRAMLDKQLRIAIEKFRHQVDLLERLPEKRLEKLKRYERHVVTEQVKAVLLSRDKLENLLDDARQNENTTATYLQRITVKLAPLDERLEHQKLVIAQVLESTPDLKRFQPRNAGEWWSFSTPSSWLDRCDWLWNLLTLGFSAVSLGFAANLLPLALAGGSGTVSGFLGVLSAIAPTLLSILTLEKTAQIRESIEKDLDKSKVLTKGRQEFICLFSLLFMILMISIFLNKANIGNCFFDQAETTFLNEDRDRNLASAESDLKLSIAFNPDNGSAHFLLGYIYELRRDIDDAEKQYKLAMQLPFKEKSESEESSLQHKMAQSHGLQTRRDWILLARVRLSNLILLNNFLKSSKESKESDQSEEDMKDKSKPKEKKLDDSIFASTAILLQGDREAKDTWDDDAKKSWYTTLAWARFQQKRYVEAQEKLDIAIKQLEELIELKKRNDEKLKYVQSIGVSAYCIQAELYEIQARQKDAQDFWERCWFRGSPSDPDEDIWRGKSRSRVEGK